MHAFIYRQCDKFLYKLGVLIIAFFIQTKIGNASNHNNAMSVEFPLSQILYLCHSKKSHQPQKPKSLIV